MKYPICLLVASSTQNTPRDMVIGPQQVSYVLMISDYAMILYYHTFYESTKVINIRRLLARLHRR